MELVERAKESGVVGYIVKPFRESELAPAIEVALARHAETTALLAEVDDLTERLAARKLIDQAKARLQERQGLSEAEAFRWIQRNAMDQRRSMAEIAADVIAGL